MITEKAVEAYLKKSMKEAGGLCWKFVSPGIVGVPDRICIFPGGEVIFVELKAPGKVPSPMQYRRLADINSLNAEATWLASLEEVDVFIEMHVA